MTIKTKNENKKMKSIGALLLVDPENNPFNHSLNLKKLDMSINSLKDVDKYLGILKKKERFRLALE